MGMAEFFGMDFAVDERVLIPRPETEIAVEKALQFIECYEPGGCRIDILDLCTGSGNIAIALAGSLRSRLLSKDSGSLPEGYLHAAHPEAIEGLTKIRTNCRIVASDISESALAVARRNAERNRVGALIEFVESDLFDDLDGQFDVIVSNPPYISQAEFKTLQKEVLKEPRIALDGGEDGLDFYRKIIPGSALRLKENGMLIMEIGYGQLEGIRDIVRKSGRLELTEVAKDWRDIDRVVVARWIS
jgi:release factor glutamine methyltransferase